MSEEQAPGQLFITLGQAMSHRTIEWIRVRLQERLVGAKWYRATELRGDRLVVRGRSLEEARKYGTSSFYNQPVTYEEDK